MKNKLPDEVVNGVAYEVSLWKAEEGACSKCAFLKSNCEEVVIPCMPKLRPDNNSVIFKVKV